LYDPDAVGDPTHQFHDFEPGIAPSGLFWTIPIAPSAIDVDPGRGRARLHADSVPVGDYGNFFQAITPGYMPTPSHVSFDVRWAGDGDRQKIRDDVFGFTGQYVASSTTIAFTAFNEGGQVIYSSLADGQYNLTEPPAGPVLPAVGHERNGKFFS
jgi:hypothetical protein